MTLKKYITVGMSVCLFLGVIQQQMAQQSPLEYYKASIPLTPEVFNGGIYVEYPNAYIGHAYFQTNSYTYTDIVFNGITYRDIPSLYDLVTQNIVVLNPIHANKVMIQSNKVSAFIINAQKGAVRFIKGKSLGVGGDYQENFLEEIIPNRLFAYHRKSVQREINGLNRDFRFDSYENLFLLHSGELISVNGKNDIIQALGINKKTARAMLKEKGIKYRADKRAYQSALVEHYQNNIKDE